jgi:hypothetical protein
MATADHQFPVDLGSYMTRGLLGLVKEQTELRFEVKNLSLETITKTFHIPEEKRRNAGPCQTCGRP